MHLICGEALFDVFPKGASGQGIELIAQAGGSPYNVAIGLARLGEPVAFLGGLSEDVFGQHLRQGLAREGVGLEYVVNAPHRTTLSMVAKDACGVPSYTFYGEDGADRMLTGADMPVLPAPVELLHFGSYTTVVDPVASAFLEWLPQAGHGRLVSLDPNVRPTVEPDMQRWRQALGQWLPSVDVLKLSDEDLGLLYPGQTAAQVANSLLQAGVRLVVVTRGGEGASAYAPGITVDVPGLKVDVVDTVGAGDSFQATLLHGLRNRAWLERVISSAEALFEVIQKAVVASAITCTRQGADPPRLDQIEAVLAAVKEARVSAPAS